MLKILPPTGPAKCFFSPHRMLRVFLFSRQKEKGKKYLKNKRDKKGGVMLKILPPTGVFKIRRNEGGGSVVTCVMLAPSFVGGGVVLNVAVGWRV